MPSYYYDYPPEQYTDQSYNYGYPLAQFSNQNNDFGYPDVQYNNLCRSNWTGRRFESGVYNVREQPNFTCEARTFHDVNPGPYNNSYFPQVVGLPR